MKTLYVFFFLTALFSAPLYFLYMHASRPGTGTYIEYLMWCPGVAALLALRSTGQSLRSIGWTAPPLRYILLPILVPFIYWSLCYGLVWMVGWGGFPNLQFVSKTSAAYVWSRFPSSVTILFYFLVLTPVSILNGITSAAGEEIGWRGLLAPRLVSRMGYFVGSLTGGVIWAMWHFPLFFRDSGSTSHLLFPMSCFSVSITGACFFATWLRMRTGSVWPAVVFHASHNSFLGMFNNLTITNDKTDRYADETGILMAIAGVMLALIFTKKSRSAKRPEASST